MSRKTIKAMLNYTLSREQSRAIQVINDNRLSCIHYLDRYNLSTTLLNASIESARKGLRSLILVDSDELLNTIKEKVALSNAANYCLILDNDDFLDDAVQAKIKTLWRENIGSDTNIQLDSVKKKAFLLSRIEKVFASQAKEIFGERRWADLILLPSRTDKNLNTINYLFDLKLTQQEFWHIRGKIEEAKSFYNESHPLNESVFSVFNIDIDTEDKIIDLKKKLVEFKLKMESILHQMDLALFKYRKSINHQLEKEYIKCQNLIDEASLMASKINSDKGDQNSKFSLFKNKSANSKSPKEIIQSIFNELDSSILLNTGIQVKVEDSDTVVSRLEILKNQLRSWHETRTRVISKMLKSLNKNNSDSPDFKEIDINIEILFSEINKSGIFVKPLENTSLNTNQQYLSIEKMLNSIKILLTYLNENKDIILWQSFYGNQNQDVKQLLFVLKRYNVNEWIPLYEKWYLDQLIEKHALPDHTVISDLLKEYCAENNEIQNVIKSEIEDKFASPRNKLSELCKQRNKDLYQKIFKKKAVDNLRAFDIIWTEKEMLTYFFPVMIMSNKIFRSNRLLNDGNWDQVYCDRTDIFTHVEKYNFLEQKVCFFAPLAESFKTCNELNIKIDNNNQSCKLLIHEYNFKGKIASLSLSDRLRAAKKLAKMLLSLNQNVRIFQMRNANIISVLSPYLNQQLLQLYDEQGIKEIMSDDSLYETVTESIIGVDRDQYFLYQDHLINSAHHNYFIWQLEVLNSFEKAGLTLINIETYNQKDNNNYISELFTNKIKKEKEESRRGIKQEA